MQEWINFNQANYIFRMYSSAHLIPLGLLLALVIMMYLFRVKLRQSNLSNWIRYTTAMLLFFLEVSYQIWVILYDTWHASFSLPLHLCSIAALLSGVMLIRRTYSIFEIVYFWGLAGASQALLTPDLTPYSFPHYLYYKFFLSHCLIILSVLFMSFVEQYRPTLKSIGKVLIVTNIYAVFIGGFNYLTGGNYLYLCNKPSGGSLIDYLGPWPWYIASLEMILLFFCLICYLPFMNRGAVNKYDNFKVTE